MPKYHFLEPYTLRNGVTIKNRIAMSPMTEQSSFEDGSITNDEIAYYRLRAGGVGMLITGCANVNDLGKGFEGELSVATGKCGRGFHDWPMPFKSTAPKQFYKFSVPVE